MPATRAVRAVRFWLTTSAPAKSVTPATQRTRSAFFLAWRPTPRVASAARASAIARYPTLPAKAPVDSRPPHARIVKGVYAPDAWSSETAALIAVAARNAPSRRWGLSIARDAPSGSRRANRRSARRASKATSRRGERSAERMAMAHREEEKPDREGRDPPSVLPRECCGTAFRAPAEDGGGRRHDREEREETFGRVERIVRTDIHDERRAEEGEGERDRGRPAPRSRDAGPRAVSPPAPDPARVPLARL